MLNRIFEVIGPAFIGLLLVGGAVSTCWLSNEPGANVQGMIVGGFWLIFGLVFLIGAILGKDL